MELKRYHTYRSGRVYGIVVPRSTMKSMELYLSHIIEAGQYAGSHVPNHTCYELIDDNYHAFAVMFSDDNCMIGSEVRVGSW